MKSLVFVVMFSFVLLSCATIYTGRRSVIHFSSEPQIAEVLINNNKIGETPLTAKVPRSIAKTNVTIQKNGYESNTFILKKKFMPISIFGVSFIFVDIATGGIVDYKENYYHTELSSNKNSIIENNKIAENKNIEKYFYVITTNDTIYTCPFQKLKCISFFSNKLDNITFTTLDKKTTSIPIQNIKSYKTLEIYKKNIGHLLLYIRTNTDYMIKKYTRVKLKETKKRATYTFMEELLENDKYHLVKSLVQETDIEKWDFTGEPTSFEFSHYNMPVYYLYIEDEVIKKVSQKDLSTTVKKYFSNHKELISKLNLKNKFKVLEEYIYKERKFADKYYNPI